MGKISGNIQYTNGDSPLYTNTKHAGNKSRLDFLIKDRENSHTRGFTPHRTKQTERAQTGQIHTKFHNLSMKQCSRCMHNAICLF